MSDDAELAEGDRGHIAPSGDEQHGAHGVRTSRQRSCRKKFSVDGACSPCHEPDAPLCPAPRGGCPRRNRPRPRATDRRFPASNSFACMAYPPVGSHGGLPALRCPQPRARLSWLDARQRSSGPLASRRARPRPALPPNGPALRIPPPPLKIQKGIFYHRRQTGIIRRLKSLTIRPGFLFFARKTG
jgi:hypothetical protein